MASKIYARKCGVMWVFCTQMCGFGTVNVLLCGKILVYNVIANAK